MSNNVTIARPYAKAVFATALQDNVISQWSTLLNTAAAVVKDQNIAGLLKDPRFTPDQRFQCVTDICNAVMTEPGRNFLNLLATYERLTVLPEIAELFETYRTEYEKTVHAEIISATALSDAEKERLTQALKIRLQRNVTLDYQIDPTLIGGTIIRAGDLVIDGSVRGKLRRLNAALAA